MDTKVLRNLSYGVYITTTMDGTQPVGCVTNSVMQITSDPTTIAVSINHDNYTNECIKKYQKFAINIMPESVDMDWIGTFGFETSKEKNKFDGIDYKEMDVLPTLPHTCGVLLCEVVDIKETSTHTIFIGKLINTIPAEKQNPMTYAYYHEVKKGTAPKKAPTYIVEETPATGIIRWVCSICGYSVEAKVLPDDFICPICGKGKEFFNKVVS